MKKSDIKKTALTFLAVLILISQSFVWAGEIGKIAQIAEKYKNTTVLIKTIAFDPKTGEKNTISGTGWFQDKSTIVTVAHLIKEIIDEGEANKEELERHERLQYLYFAQITDIKGKKTVLNVSLSAVDFKKDIAILKTEKNLNTKPKISNSPSWETNDSELFTETVPGHTGDLNEIIADDLLEEITIQPAIIGNSDAVRPGEEVIIIGYPYAKNQLIGFGIIAAVNQSVVRLVYQIDDAFLIDWRVHPSNSGSPVINMKGEVIGIINGWVGDTNIVWATPIKYLKDVKPDPALH
ncbi:MAG: trypsin-like peptidase domain-containing protein [Parcubacteria group bacterium]|nr:trypsin-like peptidase domain-containing protein [Parcubacteria group bacterium]